MLLRCKVCEKVISPWTASIYITKPRGDWRAMHKDPRMCKDGGALAVTLLDRGQAR